MNKALCRHLICPACLPFEQPLTCKVAAASGPDILSGVLGCRRCGETYPIIDGLAVLLVGGLPLTDRGGDGYEAAATVSSYLWSHYADWMGDHDATDAYRQWGRLLATDSGENCLDVGCAVGRFVFELAPTAGLVVGVDRSVSFVKSARRLMRGGEIFFDQVEEGRLVRCRRIALPPLQQRNNVEFIVADALALPFAGGMFGAVASLNVVDKIPAPLAHLKELNRVARNSRAGFLFSDPFSWSDACAPESEWLGGTDRGAFSGFGRENVRHLMTGKGGHLTPAWRIDGEGALTWKIRTHRNHFELITSEYILARR